MLGTVLTPTANVRLYHISTIKEGHFPVRLDPDLVARVGGDDVESRYMEAELSCSREFTYFLCH